jgi:hypothetical protein
MKSASETEKLSLFLHARSRDGFETIPGLSYVGISSSAWQERYVEHIESALSKRSAAKLHEAMRNMQGERVVHVHDISAFGLTKAEAEAYERKLITASTLWPKGLNMRR